ncbi:DUF3105 domain-containing protein [Kitasatospora sp. RB6PN24]|uniref:DUF3105 domain-containing protein n=1 Tax=Kitasatospora humi TaxID=2893891 RepID=UPI001E2B4DD6|nr:DUF3105 domain-containing protein [Kitasatospora humi]MCC9310974.1 DUF3105 domain-containing protein [Kitasatospora humi]
MAPEGSTSTDRRARIAQLRAQEEARERRNRILGITVAAVVAVAAAGGGAYAVTRADQQHKARQAAADAPIPGVKTFGTFSRNHVTHPVQYPQTPPVGGDHNPVWTPCMGNVYDQPVHNENAVHSLEHGAVWVTYNGKATPADIKVLSDKVKATPYSFMSPYPDEPGTITLSAWSTQLIVDSATDPRVNEFFTKYVQGPQTQEPGASCSAGSMQ